MLLVCNVRGVLHAYLENDFYIFDVTPIVSQAEHMCILA